MKHPKLIPNINSNKHNKQGFTIVELVIVIVVIGILATISMLSYNFLSGDAKKSKIIASINQAGKSIDLNKTRKGKYPVSIEEMDREVQSMLEVYGDKVVYHTNNTPEGTCLSIADDSIRFGAAWKPGEQIKEAHVCGAGGGVVAYEDGIESNTPCIPSIASLDNNNPNWTGGDIYINGNCFNDTANDNQIEKVTIGNTDCQSFKVISNNKIRCTIPEKSNGSIQDIKITNKTGGSTNNVTISYDGNNKGYMQNFRTNQCSRLARGQVQVWTDQRNTREYRIKKMPDNKCWMIDNLEYAHNSWSHTPDGQYMTAFRFEYALVMSSNDNTPILSDHFLYNSYTASGGTYAHSDKDFVIKGNICPNTLTASNPDPTPEGWRIPTVGETQDQKSTTDFAILNTSMRDDDGSNIFKEGVSNIEDQTFRPHWQSNGPFQTQFIGAYEGPYPQPGYNALYWTSNANSNGSVYRVRINKDNDYYGDFSGQEFRHFVGFALRCVVGE